MKNRMVAIAGAMALACSAFADAKIPWFDGGVAADFPTDATMSGGAWSNVTGQAEWNATKEAVVIEADDGTPLKFVATEAKTLVEKPEEADETTEVVFSSTIKFTPFETLPEVPAGAKAGLIVLTNKFYALAKDGDTNVWTNTAIDAGSPETDFFDVQVTIAANGKVTYDIDGGIFATTVAAAGAISVVSFTGDGEVSSLSATYEARKVQFTIADVANATKVVDGATLVEGNAYKTVEGDDVTVTYTADSGCFFAGGSKTAVVNAKAAKGITITTETECVAAAAKIDTTDYYTLREAFDAVTAGQTVTLLADVAEAIVNFNAVSFAFDLNDHEISSAAEATIVQNATGSTLTIMDGSANGGGFVYNGGDDADGHAVWARQGNIVINGGSFANCSENLCTIYVGDQAAKDAGSTITINGGSFSNYLWPYDSYGILKVWNGFDDTSAIVVRGGLFQTDPAEGDEEFEGSTFVVSGFQSKCCDTQEEAENATIALDDNQKTLTQEQQDAYTSLFTKVVAGTPETGFTVSFLPTEATVESVSNAVGKAAAALLAAVAAGETEFEIATKPGLYYSVGVSTTLGKAALEAAEGGRTMGDGGTLTLDVATPAEATACYYQIFVNVKDNKVD